MHFKQFLAEALPLSLAKDVTRKWKPSKYLEDVFKKYTKDHKAYRIYLPVKKRQTPRKITNWPREIDAAVKRHGYEIDDYALGIAVSNDGKKKVRIGKILNKFNEQEALKKYQEDPKLKNIKMEQKDKLAVISRHPYDLAGMSTNRGWTSCMDLSRGEEESMYVYEDIKQGAIIAYLIELTDKNINNPLGRVLIKPFMPMLDNKNKPLYVRENTPYGSVTNGFLEVVDDWLLEINEGRGKDVYMLPNELYDDSYETPIVVDTNAKDWWYKIPQPVRNGILKKINNELASITHTSQIAQILSRFNLPESVLAAYIIIYPKIINDVGMTPGLWDELIKGIIPVNDDYNFLLFFHNFVASLDLVSKKVIDAMRKEFIKHLEDGLFVSSYRNYKRYSDMLVEIKQKKELFKKSFVNKEFINAMSNASKQFNIELGDALDMNFLE